METPLPELDPAAADPGAFGEGLVRALSGSGFAYLRGPVGLARAAARLVELGRVFFALPEETKAPLAMVHGGLAWRGWFALGGELTSGRADAKEGLYLGTPLTPEEARGRPLHGPNLLPPIAGFETAVNDYLAGMRAFGTTLLVPLARGLGLEPARLTSLFEPEPTVLLRLFRYPGLPAGTDALGVGEHTDYGFLTFLWQDDVGGLEVRRGERWVPVPPREGTWVLNVGDMLERVTGGRLRSTPHRVRHVGARDRLSLPFFLDPDFGARVRPLLAPPEGAVPGRWDGEDPLAFEGTYGDWLVRKVARVFPGLARGLEMET